MPNILEWNKNKTKVRVWSTVVDDYICEFMTPEEMKEHPKYRDLVLWHHFEECYICGQKLPEKTAKETK